MPYLRGDRGDCNIRTMIGFGSHFAVKRMDAQRFVSKNARLEKADRKKDPPWLMVGGSIIRIQQSRRDVKPRNTRQTSPVRHFTEG
jgi:hypothetical protein